MFDKSKSRYGIANNSPLLTNVQRCIRTSVHAEVSGKFVMQDLLCPQPLSQSLHWLHETAESNFYKCNVLGFTQRVPTFLGSLSVPSSRFKSRILTLEDGTDRLSRNVGKELRLLAV